jgi:hypothetical protein
MIVGMYNTFKGKLENYLLPSVLDQRDLYPRGFHEDPQCIAQYSREGTQRGGSFYL